MIIAPPSPRGAASLVRQISRVLAALALLMAALFSTIVPARADALAAADVWSMYQHDLSGTNASSETILSASNAAQLGKQWSYKTGGTIAATPAAVGGTVYIGSWDGYEYALDATTGALKWKTFTGTTTAPACNPPAAGITSSASVQNGVVYVGGGDAYWYAMDAATGAVLWRVYTGDDSAAGGHYNWSSPLIYNGFAYIGIASFGDCPLVQGLLLKVDLNTHQVVATLKLVPDGQIGGGVWASPVIDPALNTLYVTTGTTNQADQTLAQAMVAIDATTLAVKGSWTVPPGQLVPDADWGTSPILYTDANGRKLVAAISKNGYVYAFDRTNVSAGPVWMRWIAYGGDSPTNGDGSVSSMALGGGRLYAAGGNTTINGAAFKGSVRALDPTTGAILWEHGVPGIVFAAPAYENGVVLVGGGSALQALDASSGTVLYSYNVGAGIYGSPSVANGVVYEGATDGTVYAFATQPAPTPPPPDVNCPSDWTCQDIGAATPAGSESVANGTWTTHAGGVGVGGASDQFRLMSTTASGNAQIAAQVTALQATSNASQAGVMARQSADPGAPYYAVLTQPNGGLLVQYRAIQGGATTVLATLTTAAPPLYVEILRTNDLFQAATSSDGTNYTLVAGTSVQLVMPTAIQAGLAASSGANGTAGGATLANVSVGAPTSTPAPAGTPHPCPNGWTCADIGNPAPVGDQTVSNGVWTMKGSGAGLARQMDQFHYVWQTATGDVTLSAHVSAQANTNPAAKAGVMLRGGGAWDAPYFGAFMTPGDGILILYRDSAGAVAESLANPAGAVPAYIEIARSGTTFTAYTSTDGVNWQPVLGGSVTDAAMGGSILAGLAVTSQAAGAQGSATLDSVSLTNSAPPPPSTCAAGWTCQDIGAPPIAGPGASLYQNGVWTLESAGPDIWLTGDVFRYAWQTVQADATVSAHLTAQTNGDEWAKAGVMLRATTDTASAYYALLMTPGNGLVVQYRGAAGAYAQQLAQISGAIPAYIEVARSGTTLTAYTSTDGTTWTPIVGSSVTLADLSGPILAGLAVASHDADIIGSATFDAATVSASAPPPPGACPSGWACQDIGAPAPAGTQSLSNGTWTVQGSGGDIWGTSDQFRFVSQSLAGDGTLSAHLTAQSNSDPWAKAGVMLRATSDANAAYYSVFVTLGNGIVVQYRSAAGINAQMSAQVAGTVPTYVEIARSGTTFTAYTSTDGVTWTPIAGSSVTIANLSGPLLAGLAVTSHNAGQLGSATFDSVAIVSGCAGGWNCVDIGAPALAGTQSLSNGTWTVQGAGGDIWDTADQFHFVSQPLAADGTLSAHLTTQSNSDPWAKAGVMLRADTTAGAAYYALLLTPGNGIVVQYRNAAGAYAQMNAQIAGVVPAYLRVARSGTTFTAYTSADGVTWTPIAGSSVTIAGMGSSILAGLAVTSHNAGQLSSATFDSVTLSASAPPPPGACPNGWTCQEIGAPALAGTQSLSNGTWTVQGAGGDIWDTADQFHFVSQPLAADGTLSAHLTTQSNSDPWAKAGVMLRADSTAGLAYYALYVTPGNGLVVQYRSAAGGMAQQLAQIAGTVPAYLRVARSGTTLTAYTSTDGTTWTPIAGSSVTIASLSGSILAGLAVTSHNAGQLSSATFDSVSVSNSAPPPPGACPSGWTCQDIGAPALAGTQSLSNGTWTVQGAGGDIWGTSDQFHFVSQALAADGTLSARLTAQSNSDPWAKAGVMLRADTTAGAAYYALLLTPGNGIVVQYRNAAGASAQMNAQIAGAVPTYLRVARSGTTFTAYISTDGVTWTPIAGSSVTIAGMSGAVFAGLAVTSHTAGQLSSTTFDSVVIG